MISNLCMAHAGQMVLCRELHPFLSSPQVCGGVFLHGAGPTNDYIPVFSNNQCTVHNVFRKMLYVG